MSKVIEVIEPNESFHTSFYCVLLGKEFDTKYIVLTHEFLKKLRNDIEELSRTEYNANSSEYKDVGRRVKMCTKQDTTEVERLLDPIIECLNSRFYLYTFTQIELAKAKAASGAISTNRSLALKHIFFMQICPEFLIQHGYQQQDKVNNLLGKKVLQDTETIFQRHLSILTPREGK